MVVPMIIVAVLAHDDQSCTEIGGGERVYDAVGMTMLYFGYNASQSVGEKVVEGITGQYSNHTMWYVIGGIAAIVGGAGLALWGGWRRAE